MNDYAFGYNFGAKPQVDAKTQRYARLSLQLEDIRKAIEIANKGTRETTPLAAQLAERLTYNLLDAIKSEFRP